MVTSSMGFPAPRSETMTVSETADSRPSAQNGEPSTSSSSENPSAIVTNPMGPPPPQNPNTTQPGSPPSDATAADAAKMESDTTSSETQPDNSSSTRRQQEEENHSQNIPIPYTVPPWSEAPCHPFYLEVLKDGSIIDQLNVNEKGAYMFGRVDLCDFVLEHPTISRFHAVLQFKGSGEAYLYDTGSTHGTSINKNQVKKKVYVDLHVGDVIHFGQSSRLYIFQGPTELMPPEKDLKSIRHAKLQQALQDREASLRRAREEAAMVDGISWGMREDAIEEAEDDVDEITWQTYKGELTEKQEKTRSKILKRMEKVAHMKKEIEAIRAKDISQGGLTQGQQTQIARNEQRISQIMEELESLEETLNDSIRESIGARAGRISGGRKKGATEDEDDDFLSDDDEFYDRTKMKPSINKSGDSRTVETADTLLDKKEAIIKEMEEKRKMLSDEKIKIAESEIQLDAGDALDAYMTGLSSQLVLDRTEILQKELSTLQTDLDRILYLLKVADPTGEAAKKRETVAQELKSMEAEPLSSAVKNSRRPLVEEKKLSRPEKKKINGPETPLGSSVGAEVPSNLTAEVSNVPESSVEVIDAVESKPIVYAPVKPQWLGAVKDGEEEGSQRRETLLDAHEDDQFVDYKDRKNILANADNSQMKVDVGLENAAPGLILRKKKQVETPEANEVEVSKQSTATGGEMSAEDAVALLLKHKRGHHGLDEEMGLAGQDGTVQYQSARDNKKPKRVLGPEKPSFLDSNSDYESWMPPEGQSGDGRTSLNDRLGY
ncbi:hypothetical protein Ancab_034900 [Ancistrocladus abbreviatus]